jgi:hypothetical protein
MHHTRCEPGQGISDDGVSEERNFPDIAEGSPCC